MIYEKRNIVLDGLHGKPILLDVFYKEAERKKPIVVFCHGFKGFKDWGTFDLVGKSFAEAGFVFLKFNFSYNGTSVEQPTEFVDLEAFGNNNFLIELDDIKVVLDALENNLLPIPQNLLDFNQLSLVGHSRGGGVTILKAAEDKRVKKLVTWASVSEFGKYWTEASMQEIKEKGVMYVPNARTAQQMPIYWQLYQSYFDNQARLHIPSRFEKLDIPILIAHGTADEVVSFASATQLVDLNSHATLLSIENSNHVFGGKHPWLENKLPDDLKKVVEESIGFLKN
jgi:pimeloyl-ACP methyl ester carboxylesterase